MIVLLTDGENNETPDPLEAAQAAADRGVRIYTVGIGSAGGHDPAHRTASPSTRSSTRRLLQQISQMTGGTYYNADNRTGSAAIFTTI